MTAGAHTLQAPWKPGDVVEGRYRVLEAVDVATLGRPAVDARVLATGERVTLVPLPWSDDAGQRARWRRRLASSVCASSERSASVRGWASGDGNDSSDTLAFAQRAGVRSRNEVFGLEDAAKGYEVRWAIAGKSIVTQLVSKLDDGEYMAFGLSGDNTKTKRFGGTWAGLPPEFGQLQWVVAEAEPVAR